jgi:co-chaperonin GroES (HSP10)
MSDTLKPLANHVLVALPHRYAAPKGPRSPDGLGITLIEGADAMRELEAQIKRGGELQIETATDKSISNLVRVGQVLAIPPCLTEDMVLCAAGNNKVRTYADITPVVEVGDTVYLDWSCLTDEREILPGIYNVPYAAIICTIYTFKQWDKALDDGKPFMPISVLRPVGGYVLLSRVWADDVTDYELDDRMQKVRWNEAGTLIAEYDVPPLPNEGQVAWVDAPLKGALNELHPGQRVVISAGHALIENIAGSEYLVIRHDYVLAVEQPAIPDGLAMYMPEKRDVHARVLKERYDEWVASRLPLELDNYLA